MSQELAIIEGTTLPMPREIAAQATEQAKTLMEIVRSQRLYTTVGGKDYMHAEAWETIGAFNRTHAATEYVRPIVENDETIGYEAKVNIVKDGEIVGSGIAVCGLQGEFVTKGKTGFAQRRAAMSAAQTWATSKAYRMNFSWVAVLAGFQPTPAEEMADEAPSKPAQPRQPQARAQTPPPASAPAKPAGKATRAVSAQDEAWRKAFWDSAFKIVGATGDGGASIVYDMLQVDSINDWRQTFGANQTPEQAIEALREAIERKTGGFHSEADSDLPWGETSDQGVIPLNAAPKQEQRAAH